MITIPSAIKEYRRDDTRAKCDDALSRTRAPGTLTMSKRESSMALNHWGYGRKSIAGASFGTYGNKRGDPPSAACPKSRSGKASARNTTPKKRSKRGRFATFHKLPNGNGLIAGVAFEEDSDLRLGRFHLEPRSAADRKFDGEL